MGAIDGFALGMAGFVYQTVFRNPLASPDVIGVSSGASAGAAAGIAVHALAQTILMCLKLTADPERQLASIEYWIMGSLNGINSYSIGGNILLCLLCLRILFPLHRQIILLSGEEGESRMLGVNVGSLRLFVLLSGLLGGSLLIGADILARSVAASELPVSIFTSLLGAPFLILLIYRSAKKS